MPYIKSYFEKHKFIKNIATLMSGTVLAQLITFLSMLLITNFYTASDFGVYALFISVSSIFTVIATGRYELAIILPKHHGTALNILVLIAFISLLFCSALFIFVFFSYSFIIKYFNIQLGYNVLQLLAVFVFFSSLSQAFYYFFNRFAEYKIMSLSRLIYSLINALTMYFFGKCIIVDNGLVISCVISNIALIIFYLTTFLKKYKILIKYIRLKTIKNLAFKYRDFPRYSLLGECCSNFSLQLPTFLLSVFYNNSILGYYSLSYRCIVAPLQIITSSFGDIFRKEASEAYINLGNCKLQFIIFAKKLFIISLILFLPLLFLGKDIFVFIFGEQWEISGIYAQILAPMFILRLIANPMSNVSIITEHQGWGLIIQLLIIVLVSSAVIFSKMLFESEITVIISFAISYSVVYMISLILNYKWSKGEMYE